MTGRSGRSSSTAVLPSAGSDSVEILGTGVDDAFAYAATGSNGGTMVLTSGGSTTNYLVVEYRARRGSTRSVRLWRMPWT